MNIPVTVAGRGVPRPATRPLRFECAVCDATFTPKRTTKRFCSDRCRKVNDRAAENQPDAADLEIRDQLTARRFVGQVWPVYRWDEDPVVRGLLVPLPMAARELGISQERLSAVLRRFGVARDQAERKRIADFYAKRKDRRVRRDEDLSRTKMPGEVE